MEKRETEEKDYLEDKISEEDKESQTPGTMGYPQDFDLKNFLAVEVSSIRK